MKFITSIGPNRIERQQCCVASWESVGATVTAVQSPGESEKLQPLFPSVRFVETNLVGNLFNRPRSVRIKALLNEVTETSLIINSDINIITSALEFAETWKLDNDRHIKMGIRWDYHPKRNIYNLLKYGIDVFLLSPEAALDLPDIGMTIGCPGWDYWLPWHLNMLQYKIETIKRKEFIHELHVQNWNNTEYRTGLKLITNYYPNLTDSMLSTFIQELTDRTKLKPGKMKL